MKKNTHVQQRISDSFRTPFKKAPLFMKASAFFLLCSMGIAQASNSYAQKTTLKIEVQNTTVQEVLNKIEKDSDFSFFYNNKHVDLNRQVSINAKNGTVFEILEDLFAGTNVTYTVLDKKVILTLKNEAVQQNTFNITGVVVDKNGEPIIGASIVEKGTTNGIVTDLDGRFALNLNSKNARLEVSYIGYKTQIIKASAGKQYTISLEEDNELLDEVVVVGYGSQRKINLTGALTEVKGKDIIEDRPVTHVGQSLQGKIPGLVVTKSSGRAGSGYSFNIRGTTSLNGGSPLVLVDGVEMDANLLPPEEIESITVLKDAASAAIYGSRAAFGVVLITTKSGEQDQKIKVNYSTNLSWTKPTDTPKKVNGQSQIKWGAYASGNQNGNYDIYQGKVVDTWLNLYEENRGKAEAVWLDNKFYPLGIKDPLQNLIETGFLQKHNASVSGGSKKISYYINAGLTKQDGILITNKDKYTRKNISAKLKTEVNDWLSFELNMGYITSKNEMPWIPYGESFLYGQVYGRPSFVPTGVEPRTGIPYGYSGQLMNLGAPCYNKNNNYRMQGLVTIKPLKGLTINARYTYRRNDGDNMTHINKYLSANPAGGGVNYFGNNIASITRSASKSNYNVFDIWGEYNLKIANDHNFKLMVGYNQESYDALGFNATRENLISDFLPSLNLGTGNRYVGDSSSEWATRSAFYRFNYDYKGRYLFETVGRYDGSSRFPKNDRFAFFPSFSLGWRISEESFMDWSKEFLDNLKFRISYGMQGNQSIALYAYTPSMGSGLANWITGSERPLIINPAGLVSDSFTWEKVYNGNIGLDMAFFKNRLNVTTEFYKRSTKGMLMLETELPALLGIGAPKTNAADLEVKGWELSANWRDKIGDLSYNIGFNLYDSQTKIKKYTNPNGLYNQHYAGKKLGEIWGYDTDRLFTEDDFVTDNNGKRQYKEGIPTQNLIFKNEVPSPGDVKYKDLDGDGEITYGNNTLKNPGDKHIIGNSTPRYHFGINLGASYKGFDVSCFMQGVAKRDLFTSSPLIFFNGNDALVDSSRDFWTPEKPNAFLPRPIMGRDYNTQCQSRYLLDASYLRFKNITLGYTVPANIINKLSLSKFRVYVSAENLFTLTGLPKGLDPEVGPTYSHPFTKELSFGIDISF